MEEEHSTSSLQKLLLHIKKLIIVRVIINYRNNLRNLHNLCKLLR